MLELVDIAKTYREGTVETPVFHSVNFAVSQGEFVAIMGASGTGKSTLMNILGCLDTPTGGTYRLDGMDVFQHDDDTVSAIRNRKIGFVFQQFHLLDRASALDNVLLPLIYSEHYPGDAEKRGTAALEALGLGDRVHHRANQLSGGQQQRVAIARALITDPALILADEPTGNLDRMSGLEIIAILQKLNREGRTIVLITHDPIVADHAHRVLVLDEGRIISDSRPEKPLNADEELASLREGVAQ